MIVESLNISLHKGTVKTPVASFILDANGIVTDAHAGPWHRQVSILSSDSIESFSTVLGREIHPGEFAENITLRGFDARNVNPLDLLVSGDIILQVTQIGKECHGNNCAIFQQTGDCVMPKEGVFCRVIRGGELKEGAVFEHQPKIFKIQVITLSDRCSAQMVKDSSGPLIVSKLKALMESQNRACEVSALILPDDIAQLQDALQRGFEAGYDLVFTTGSTGIGPRDIAPEAIKPLLDKEIPGIMDMIRWKYGVEKPGALLSRALAGVKGQTLLFALPGSPKAVGEYMAEISKLLFHAFFMIHSIDKH